jgi:hypothetical protein
MVQQPKFSLGPKQFVATFLVVAAAYFSVFYGIEYLRHRHGPWQATFAVGTDGEPSVTVRQPALGLEGVELRFPGEATEWAGGATNVVFGEPGVEVPFGEVIYEDLTFLPGVVTFNLFGHLVEFMPRVLNLNHREAAWDAAKVHTMDPQDPPKPPPGGTRER